MKAVVLFLLVTTGMAFVPHRPPDCECDAEKCKCKFQKCLCSVNK